MPDNLLVKSIKYLQIHTFQGAIDEFMPEAKIVRVFLSEEWTMLIREPHPKKVSILWTNICHPNVKEHFIDCITNIQEPTIIFVDEEWDTNGLMESYRNKY